jgi:hypothetical protein
LKHLYQDELVEDETFAVAVDYLKPLKGAAREAAVKRAGEVAAGDDEVAAARAKRLLDVLPAAADDAKAQTKE